MLYLLSAFFSLALARRAPRIFWWTIVCILIVLGLSSLLNLSQHITSLGRRLAYMYGVYNTRGRLQTIGIAIVLFASVFMVAGISNQLRSLRPPEWIALAASGALVNLTIIRTISFHDLDYFFGKQFVGIQIGFLMESILLLCIVASAAWAGRQCRTTEPRTSPQLNT